MPNLPRGLPSSREKEELQEAVHGFRSFIWPSEHSRDTSNLPGSLSPLANLSHATCPQPISMSGTSHACLALRGS